MEFVLTHGPAPNEDMALEALHGTANGHDYWVDLHCYLTRRSQDKDLQDEEKNLTIFEETYTGFGLLLIISR